MSDIKRALISGSFDPVTVGHVDVIQRALKLFDEVWAVIFQNSLKHTQFTLEQRVEMLTLACEGMENVKIGVSNDMTSRYALDNGITAVVKGVRGMTDFEYEYKMHIINGGVYQGIETVLLPSKPEYLHVSSTVVKEFLKYGADISAYVPAKVKEYINML